MFENIYSSIENRNINTRRGIVLNDGVMQIQKLAIREKKIALQSAIKYTYYSVSRNKRFTEILVKLLFMTLNGKQNDWYGQKKKKSIQKREWFIIRGFFFFHFWK